MTFDHVMTQSLYFLDPDGNRFELFSQVMPRPEAKRYLHGAAFRAMCCGRWTLRRSPDSSAAHATRGQAERALADAYAGLDSIPVASPNGHGAAIVRSGTARPNADRRFGAPRPALVTRCQMIAMSSAMWSPWRRGTPSVGSDAVEPAVVAVVVSHGPDGAVRCDRDRVDGRAAR